MRVLHFAYIVVAITTFVVATYLLLNDEAQLPNSSPDQLVKTEDFPLAEKPDRLLAREEEARLQEDDSLATDHSPDLMPSKQDHDQSPDLIPPKQNLDDHSADLVPPKQNLDDHSADLVPPKQYLEDHSADLISPKQDLEDHPADLIPSKQNFSYLTYYAYSEVPPDTPPADTVLESLKGVPAGRPIEEIKRASDAFGLDFNFMTAVAKIESDFDPKQRTGSYIGLFQLSNTEFRNFGSGDMQASTYRTNKGKSAGRKC
jgi:hypothetical protein